MPARIVGLDNGGDTASALTGAQGSAVKMNRRGQVWDRCGGRCFWCGRALHPFWTFTVDHLVPRCRGGTDAIDNLVASCGACNESKGDRLLLAANGRTWLAPSGDPQ